MRVPLGVIGIIYESRPNVTADAAGLCLKAGNACILRGGSEALHSNQAIAACVRAGLKAAGPARSRGAGGRRPPTAPRWAQLITMTEYVDIIVPRGGKELIERLSRESNIPMIKHLDGVCHVYIDDRADPEMAVRIADNAKTQRYGTCNTMETLLVAEGIAAKVLPLIGTIYKSKSVEMRGDEATRKLVQGCKARHGKGLLHRVAGAHRLDPRGEGSRRGDRAHRQVRLAAHRRHRHRGQGARRPLPARSRFELGDGQCLDALRRRLRVRPGRRDRHLHRQAARARPGRPRGPDDAEVRRARARRDPQS